MLVSINSTEITTDEIRISATNLETILLADDLFQNIGMKMMIRRVTKKGNHGNIRFRLQMSIGLR